MIVALFAKSILVSVTPVVPVVVLVEIQEVVLQAEEEQHLEVDLRVVVVLEVEYLEVLLQEL